MKLANDDTLGRTLEWTAPEGLEDVTIEGAANLDPRGSDVGYENPYNNGGDSGASYPNYSDPSEFPRCAWEGSMIPCGMKDRIEDTEARVHEAEAENKHNGAAYDVRRGGDIAHESQHDTFTAQAITKTAKPKERV